MVTSQLLRRYNQPASSPDWTLFSDLVSTDHQNAVVLRPPAGDFRLATTCNPNAHRDGLNNRLPREPYVN